jgi:hypothetical protein
MGGNTIKYRVYKAQVDRHAWKIGRVDETLILNIERLHKIQLSLQKLKGLSIGFYREVFEIVVLQLIVQ